MTSTIQRIDPIDLAIYANRVDSITREMTNTMLRTARSTTMAARDFSCSITSGDHDLLSAPGGIPVHVYGSSLVAQSMAEMHPDFKEGDAFLHNDPYMGNTHAADHTLLVPVFFKGEHVFTAIAKAHQIDIGNSQPTTYMPAARDVYEEGALIFPCVKVQENCTDVADIIGMARRRIRAFDTWYGDFLAALGAVRLAEKRLKEFCESFDSIEHVREFIREWLDYSERMAAAGIAKLPAGQRDITTTMDTFPGLPESGLPLKATIDVRPDEGRVLVDLRDNPDCTPTGLNLTEATAKNSAVTAVLMALNTDRHAQSLLVPNNSGSHRRIEVLLRENCVVGIPQHPASCSTATRTITDRVTGMLLAGIATMSKGTSGAAEPCLGCGPQEGVVSGKDARRQDEDYILQIFAGTSGGPATAETDGWLAFANIMGAGIPRLDSTEIVEQRYPLIVWQHATVRPDSEGAGKFRGAPGSSCAYGPRFSGAESHYYMEGVTNRPLGVCGGGPALGPEAWHIFENGSTQQVHEAVAATRIAPGEAVAALTSGGGGYGIPFDRDPAQVLEDVIDEYISIERARDTYGVVVIGDAKRWETLQVDEEATAVRRSSAPNGDLDGGRQADLLPVWWAADEAPVLV